MNDRTVEIFRSALTVIGILLLVIFGSRAAAQARNMKLAGATHKSVFAVGTDILNVLGLSEKGIAPVSAPRPLASHLPAQIQAVTPVAQTPAAPAATETASIQTAVQNSTTTSGTNPTIKEKPGKATGAVNGKSKQLVNNSGKHNSDDFANLWP